MTTIVFSETLWTEVAGVLDLSVETAGVILARRAETPSGTNLLARRIVWVPTDGYVERRSDGLVVSSTGYVPALKDAADDGSVAIFFHSHPGGRPNPSHWDATVDEQLRIAFQIRTGQPIYASLILGGRTQEPSFSGQVWVDDQSHGVSALRVVGSRLVLLSATDEFFDSDLHSRQILAFGAKGQAALRRLHVGVVGLGGTGSAVFEQLVRMGVGRVTVVDDDTLSRSNLSRIHESDASQVGMSKVAVAKAFAGRQAGGSEVVAIEGRITDEAAARTLTSCDVIFGCTDDNRGRAVLSRLAYWYLIPVVDMGFVVDAAEGRVRGLYGRVTILAPGTACLFCRGRIDAGQLIAEALPEEERDRLEREGYVRGLATADPSVGTYTTLTGAFAVAELIDRMFGFSVDPLPSEILLRVTDRAMSTNTIAPKDGHYCAEQSHWGLGDCVPFLDQIWV